MERIKIFESEELKNQRIPDSIYKIYGKNVEFKVSTRGESRLIVKYNIGHVPDINEREYGLYYYAVEQYEGVTYNIKGSEMFDKIEIDGKEVSIEELDNNHGVYSVLGEHVVKYTLKDPTVIGAIGEVISGTPVFSKIGATFSNCQDITEIIIPSSVTTIGNGAIMQCYNIENIIIPDSVIEIADMAFVNDSGLESITIGKNVVTIGQAILEQCSSLTDIIMLPSVPPTFTDGVDLPDVTIHVPEDSLELYRTAYEGYNIVKI